MKCFSKQVWCVLALGIVLCGLTQAGARAQEPSTQVADVVKQFIEAQHTFDLTAITRLTAPTYVEISPLGEVDPREKMLGFYTPDKKQPAPATAVDTPDVRLYGDTAIATTKLGFDAPGPDGNAVKREMRAVFLVHREGGMWKLVSAQYTGIRSKR